MGGSLALAGATFQAILRNPLAEPYILGISGGASVGAVLVLALGLAGRGSWVLPLAAFAGAFLGATSIIPGRFNPVGSLIGVYLLATGIAGLQIFGIPNFVQDLFWGGGLIAAVAASQLVRRRKPMEIG